MLSDDTHSTICYGGTMSEDVLVSSPSEKLGSATRYHLFLEQEAFSFNRPTEANIIPTTLTLLRKDTHQDETTKDASGSQQLL